MKASDALAAAHQLLVDAGRPLSVRRLWKQALEAEDITLAEDVDTLRALLQDKGDRVGISEVRRGVFALADAPARTPTRARAKASDPDDKRKRRRKMPTQREIAGDDPATALTVEDAMATAEAGDDLGALRRQLWDRVRARAAAVVNADPRPETIDVEPVEESAPALDPADAEAALHAAVVSRLNSRAAEPKKKKKKAKKAKKPEASEAPVAAEPSEAEQSAVEALRERVRGRRKPGAGKAAKADKPAKAAKTDKADKPAKADKAGKPGKAAKRAYVDERADVPQPEPKVPERRAPTLPVSAVADAAAEAILEALREAGKPLAVKAIADAIGRRGRGAVRAVQGAISAENGRAQAAGLRPPFAVRYEGEVALTEWGLAARYRALEETILAALAEQRELVQRGLLERTSDLGGEAFEQVLTLLLERMGFTDLEVVHRSGANVALTASRDDGRVTVVAQRSWSAVKADTIEAIRATLPHFGTASALVLTMGDYQPAARAAAAEVPAVALIDGPGWAALLYEHGVGVAAHQPTLRYVDGGFFDALSP